MLVGYHHLFTSMKDLSSTEELPSILSNPKVPLAVP
jgi:hypothetical protein